MRLVILRWVLAALCLLLGMGRHWGVWGVNAFMNLVVFIVAFSLVAPEVVFWLAGQFSMPFVRLLFPNLHFPKPPLSYHLARRYRDERRLEDAADQYQEIIRHYPDEAAAYVELIEVAIQMGDGALAEKYAARYHRRFKQDAPAPLGGAAS
jgi:hypothetical protein